MMLERFYHDFNDLDLTTLDDEYFARTIHNIKGMSAGIGASTLHTICKTLDATLDRSMIPLFHEALRDVIEELSQLQKDNIPKQPHPITSPSQSEDKAALFSQLKEAVMSKRLKRCEPVIQALRGTPLNEDEKSRLEEIDSLVHTFKFKQAIIRVKELF
jgi:HPt (histidine-containing phosphotransfer) domain-containing protein